MPVFVLALFSCASGGSRESGFTLTSKAVENGRLLEAYQCDEDVVQGRKIGSSIPLQWSNVPAGTKSLAITMIHYPKGDTGGTPNQYLLMWGIDPSIKGIAHGEAGNGNGFIGANKDGNGIGYTSPCSPRPGASEYSVNLYALSETPTSLPAESTADVDYQTLINAIDTVQVFGKTVMTFTSVQSGTSDSRSEQSAQPKTPSESVKP